MIKLIQATSDGDAYESNESEGIWTAGINLPFRPESIFSRSMDPVWNSRIECHGESKEDAEELRDAVLTAVSNPERLQDVTLAERLRRTAEFYDTLYPHQKLSIGVSGDVSDLLREAATALSVRGDGWIAVADRLPEIRDGGVLVYFSKSDAVETVNIEDYFRPITAGLDDAGNQLYALWATSAGVTHWMPLPEPPATPPSEG